MFRGRAGAGRRQDGGRRRRHRAPASALCIAALLGAGAAAPPAGAVLVELSGRTLSYLPVHPSHAASAKSSKSPVLYHGGPVMSSNANYTLYWDPSGAPSYPAGYETGVDRWLEDLAHDSGGIENTDSVLIQYTGTGGEAANYESQFAGALADPDPYPANGCSAAPVCLTDEQIRSELAAYVEAHKLPTDLAHEYFVLTPPGIESCLEASGKSCSDGTAHPGFCAYHGFIPVAKGVIVYADDPYVAGLACDPGEQHPNENASDATIAGGMAHEHSESVTDPELNAWYDSKGQEVADKCRTFKQKTEFGEPLGTAPDGADYNQVIDGDLYWYQQMWSNETGACEQRLASLPTITKLAPSSGSTAGGTAVTISGSGFASSASVSFGGTPATGVVVNSSSSLTAIAPAHAAGTAEVTVTTSSGTSAPTKKDRFKYKSK
jgi:hypothetical protein